MDALIALTIVSAAIIAALVLSALAAFLVTFVHAIVLGLWRDHKWRQEEKLNQ